MRGRGGAGATWEKEAGGVSGLDQLGQLGQKGSGGPFFKMKSFFFSFSNKQPQNSKFEQLKSIFKTCPQNKSCLEFDSL
jgi:hypothetical protein